MHDCFTKRGLELNYKTSIFLAGTALVLAACSADEAPTAAPEAAATATAATAEDVTKHITEEYIREVMIEISDDSYEGRGPATKGDLMTREFLVEQMTEIGLFTVRDGKVVLEEFLYLMG